MTKERVYRMGINQDSLCEICGSTEETTNHLFFECPLARRCIEDIHMWLNIDTRKSGAAGAGEKTDQEDQRKNMQGCDAILTINNCVSHMEI